MKGFLTGVAVFAVTFAIVFYAGGGGHGSYIPTKILFPYYVLLVGGFRATVVIRSCAMILSIGQFPLYGYAVQKAPKFALAVIGTHILAAVVCLRLTIDTFSP